MSSNLILVKKQFSYVGNGNITQICYVVGHEKPQNFQKLEMSIQHWVRANKDNLELNKPMVFYQKIISLSSLSAVIIPRAETGSPNT